MNKKIIIIILLAAIVIAGGSLFYAYQTTRVQVPEKIRVGDAEKYKCGSDTDCVIKNTECKLCNALYECTNKDWYPTCDKITNDLQFCVWEPSSVSSCKCINSKCANCGSGKCNPR